MSVRHFYSDGPHHARYGLRPKAAREWRVASESQALKAAFKQKRSPARRARAAIVVRASKGPRGVSLLYLASHGSTSNSLHGWKELVEYFKQVFFNLISPTNGREKWTESSR